LRYLAFALRAFALRAFALRAFALRAFALLSIALPGVCIVWTLHCRNPDLLRRLRLSAVSESRFVR
jgi:hypothetical protein